METWKPILGYEGLYEISDAGRVRRVSRGKRFTAEQVDKAKAMFADGAALADVANFLGTSITTAFSIKKGKTWAGDSGARPVKTHVARDHYIRFSPCKDGKYVKMAVHRAMWEAFVGPIPKGMEINHKNLDRADNRLENLELLTHRENVQHAFDAYRENPASRQPAGKAGSYRGRYFKHQ
jgi:hypothetical protein